MPSSNRLLTGTVAIAVMALPTPLFAQADGHAHDEPCPRGERRIAADQPLSRSNVLAITSPPDGITLAVGGPALDTPWIISPPVRGSGGVQGLFTVCDRPEFLLRLGAGVANVQLTRTAPPFQQGPARRWNADGSELAWRLDDSELYASVQRRNWGPGWTGSLILDGAAQPLAAVGWRRPLLKQSSHPWLQWMGPWQADLFFGQLWGHEVPRLPALMGMRLLMQPFDQLQLGLSRTMQWGGHGRDESLTSLLRSLVGLDNVGSHGVTVENQPGNQLAGLDWRWQLGADRDNAFYGQIVGEDQRHGVPSANIVQAGLQAHAMAFGAEWLGFAEWNDVIAAQGAKPGVAYTSNVYQQGYTHDRMPLGYPAGGDVRLGSLGLLVWAAGVQAALVVSRGNALPTAQRFAPGPISGFSGSLQIDIDPRQQLGAGFWWWRDTAQQQRALQLWWRALL